MKKFGFTMAEVLISMTIIGLVAALTAPTLINLMPNKDKVQTIKYQKMISEINADLLNNRTLYSNGEWDNKSLDHIPEYGILLEQSKKNKLYKNKYVYLLIEKLEGVDINDVSFSSNSNKIEFNTADGYQWIVETDSSKVPKTITIDTDGTGTGNDLLGNSSSDLYPDRFMFDIDRNVGYAGCNFSENKITCRYLNCPFYMNNRKLDYECIQYQNPSSLSSSNKCYCGK